MPNTCQNLQEHVCESQFGHSSKGFRQKTFYSSYEDWIEGTQRRIGRAGKAGMGGVKWGVFRTLGVHSSNHSLGGIKKDLWLALEQLRWHMVNIPHHNTFTSLPRTKALINHCTPVWYPDDNTVLSTQKVLEKIFDWTSGSLLTQYPRKSLQLYWDVHEMTWTCLHAPSTPRI